MSAAHSETFVKFFGAIWAAEYQVKKFKQFLKNIEKFKPINYESLKYATTKPAWLGFFTLSSRLRNAVSGFPYQV